jgi:hypothetical protein
MTYDRRRADTDLLELSYCRRQHQAAQCSPSVRYAEHVGDYRVYLKNSNDSDEVDLLAIVQYRGGPEEFRAGLALLASSDPRERVAGADILAQLGWQDRTFLEESVDALLCALRDPDDQVVQFDWVLSD